MNINDQIKSLEKDRDEKGKAFAEIAYNDASTDTEYEAAKAALEEAKTALFAAQAALITPERLAELARITSEGEACEGTEAEIGARQQAAYVRANRGLAFAPRCACGGMTDVSADAKSCRDCR